MPLMEQGFESTQFVGESPSPGLVTNLLPSSGPTSGRDVMWEDRRGSSLPEDEEEEGKGRVESGGAGSGEAGSGGARLARAGQGWAGLGSGSSPALLLNLVLGTWCLGFAKFIKLLCVYYTSIKKKKTVIQASMDSTARPWTAGPALQCGLPCTYPVWNSSLPLRMDQKRKRGPDSTTPPTAAITTDHSGDHLGITTTFVLTPVGLQAPDYHVVLEVDKSWHSR